MKMRDFWIVVKGYNQVYNQADLDNAENPSYITDNGFKVREVDPEWDTLVEEMVEVLRGYSLDGIAASKVLAKYNKLMDKK